jgi:hypothetical protein
MAFFQLLGMHGRRGGGGMFSWILDHDTRFWLLASLAGFVYLMILSLVFGLQLFVLQKIAGRDQQ